MMIKKILSRVRKRNRNNSGIVLFIVLWVLVILTMLAVGLGRNSNVELVLVKHAVGKVKAKYLAWAGVMFAVEQIRLDTKDVNSQTDTSSYCGIPVNKNISLKELFEQELKTGYFSVEYFARHLDGVTVEKRYGLEDEERKININALTLQNLKVLSSLVVLVGFDEEVANEIAYSVVDWIDGGNDTNYGAEDDYYMGLAKPYHCKNLPFDSKEEWMLVKGMTPEIFDKIKNYITIFPKNAQTLRINYDTASKIVLQALARGVSGAATNTDIGDADALVEKMINYRKGDDALDFTADDQVIEEIGLELNQNEEGLFRQMNNSFRTKQSNYFNVRVKGIDKVRGAQENIQAIIARENLAIVHFHKGR